MNDKLIDQNIKALTEFYGIDFVYRDKDKTYSGVGIDKIFVVSKANHV